MTDKGYSLIRFGNVCEVDPAKGYARVEFDEDGITSALLPVCVAGALDNKYFAMPAVNEQVVCIMDDRCEQGAIIGALYSAKDAPQGFGAGISGVIYSDGSKLVYDENTGKWTMQGQSSDSIGQILSDLMDQMLLETHPTGTGPSGPPVNAGAYSAIKTRINALFG